MASLHSVSFNQLPPDSVCVSCYESLEDTEDTYRLLSSELDLAAAPSKYVVHRGPNGQVYQGSILHPFCFDRWAMTEMGAGRLLRCPHCCESVATLDGRNIEQIFANRVVPQPVIEAPLEEWGDLEIILDPVMDRQRGLLEQIGEFLEAGRLSDEDRQNLILWAAAHNRMDVITLVIADQPISDQLRGEAIVRAVDKGGHIGIVQGLLASGLISVDWRGRAVKHAAALGYIEILQCLLANGPISSWDKYLGIREADRNPHTELEIVRLLLAHGLLKVEDRGTAILDAVNRNRSEVARLLIASGRIRSDLKAEALRVAVREGSDQMVQILKSARVAPSPLTLQLVGAVAALATAVGIAMFTVKD